MNAKLLYTPREAADLLGISRSTLYVLLASEQIGSVHIGASRRITADALRNYVAQLHESQTGTANGDATETGVPAA